ncbi:pyrroline-5-carboxylate reductase [Thermodesulfobacteriota bacterium]
MSANIEKIGFIGAGNMANAMVKGLLESNLYVKEQITVSDKDIGAVNRFSEQFGVNGSRRNTDLVGESSIIVLSIKPQNMKDVLYEIQGDIMDNHLIISIAAGIPLKMIHSNLKRDIPLVRVMPNTPALIQKGISAIAAGEFATEEHLNTSRKIFDSVGETVTVDESMMDAVTALSGSGPGYVFRIMESMVEAGTKVGLERKIALDLVIQTFLGAAHLAKVSDESLSTLRERVTSPGGTTAAGLRVFEELDLEGTIVKAIKAANDRSIELGKTD